VLRLWRRETGDPGRGLGVTHPPAILQSEAELPDTPAGAIGLAPSDTDDLARILRYATERQLVVDVRGGGSHHGFGSPPPPDLVVSMSRFDGIQEWHPDDLTVVVGAGTPVASLEAILAEQSQTAVLPEVPGNATVGGVVAAGLSSLRRARLLGTRERVLEVTVVTGDGRVVTAGGRVVKNVTGYDLPRMTVGAFGSLGVITSMCLKVLPVPEAAATIVLDDLGQAIAAHRPLALLETNDISELFLWGTEPEVDAVAGRVGGRMRRALHWPADPEGALRWSLRVPPALMGAAIAALPEHWRYLAVHGAGDLRLASDSRAGAGHLRAWAESVGGHLVVVDAPPAALPDFDRWGEPPPGLELQRRIIAQFDPARVINPGRLPGGL